MLAAPAPSADREGGGGARPSRPQPVLPPLGTLVSVHGAVSVEEASGSLKSALTGRPCRSRRRPSSTACRPQDRLGAVCGGGGGEGGLVAGGVADPGALVVSAIVKAPTAVSGAPAPSVIVRVAWWWRRRRRRACRRWGSSRASRGRCRPCRQRASRRNRRDTVDLAVRVGVLHHEADEHGGGVVGGGGRGERGLVAGGVADPGALTARTTLKVPTAVLAAPAPSLIARVAVAAAVETAARVPRLARW